MSIILITEADHIAGYTTFTLPDEITRKSFKVLLNDKITQLGVEMTGGRFDYDTPTFYYVHKIIETPFTVEKIPD